MIFTNIKTIEIPDKIKLGTDFTVIMTADGEVPFAQIIIRHSDGWEWIVKDQLVECKDKYCYHFKIPADAYHSGMANLQIEGCRVADISNANPEDWVTEFRDVQIVDSKSQPVYKPIPKPNVTLGDSDQPVIYFGIHKHMHQPYYNATDTDYWDGEKDDIFGQRGGPYTHLIPAAVQQYIDGGLSHAGLSTSWSGSLIEQLNRCAETGRGHGAFSNWNQGLRNMAQAKTAFGNPRVDFSAFGFCHPLMPLIPNRDIIGQVKWHQQIIRETFGTEASDVMFPPETAFQPHMIPALKQAGVNAIMYDSIHHFRACKDYPYAGSGEGMLPPNQADQENSAVNDWLALNNIWAPSKISPNLLKPCMLRYTDHTGNSSEIIGIPAERYLGNEDARGGYGALQYEGVMGQIYNQIQNSFDPKHPPFFILHSDGDNYGGGADSYYTCNTGG
ncbi:MAG: glycosyl hydrolase family 57, partial [Proteobacteria bacterium]|nr:glycosyl hydrolase family 57 [Pseudomonadota bacterium]